VGSSPLGGVSVTVNGPHNRGAEPGRAVHNRGHGVFLMADG
jgi:hypothetical protein